MNQLLAYTPNLLKSFNLQADLKSQSLDQLVLTFEVENKNDDVDFKTAPVQVGVDKIKRQDELWKQTCFEFFLNPVGEKKYYEFNFGLNPVWNCYVFDSYRNPQPPKASTDFEILKFSWTGTRLEVSLQNRSPYKKFNIGITAVIKDKKDQTHYFALKHAGEKPDFHLQNSFILQRGS